jgi:hypothetical protein
MGKGMQFSKDPLVNAIYQGVKKGIEVTFDSECYGPCLILIYCGMDTMSYLSMPPSHTEVCSGDFIRWGGKYLSPKLSNSSTQITGEELYAARCGVVHTYGVESRKTKMGNVRMIGYSVGGKIAIAYDPKIDGTLVMLRLETLRDAFFKAIDEFLMESYADSQRRATIEARLQTLLNTKPF